jgi:hypothetical protein
MPATARTHTASPPTTSPTGAVLVHAAAPVKPVDRAASGSLYGLADDSRPPQRLLAALRPKSFTQMAPGGGQLPNGETSPSGDALRVAPRAESVEAQVIVRLADSFPDFPYRWTSWPDWLDRVEAAVTAVATCAPQVCYAFELWNEPNWTWDADPAGDFAAGWTRTWQAVRTADPTARTMGPSIDRWDAAYLRDFLRAAAADGTVPDVVSWHELDPADTDVVAHMAAYRALERELGLDPRPVSINEYGAHRDMAVPSRLAGWVARLERARVDTANLAFWHRPGRLADLVTATGEPTGGWWVYRWYAQMAGSMLAVQPSSDADAFAARSPEDDIDIVVTGTGGTVPVEIDGLDDVTAVYVEVDVARWTGTDGALPRTERWFWTTVPVVDGRATLTLDDTDPFAAYRLRVRPASNPLGPEGCAPTSRVWAVDVRDTGEVGGGDGHPAWVAPSPGAGWRLRVPATRLPTHGLDVLVHCRRLTDAPATVTVAAGGSPVRTTVPAGSEHDLRCTVAAADGADLVVTSTEQALAVDYVELRAFARRLEAEDGRIVRGSVFVADPSPASFRTLTFSGRGQVEHLDEIGASVTVDVTVPCHGDYSLTLGYSNDADVAARMPLAVDGAPVACLELPGTQGWGLIGRSSARVPMAAGPHALTVRQATRDGHVTLDYVDVCLDDATQQQRRPDDDTVASW